MRDIFVFGDSIAYGQWDEQGGWVQRLRSSYDQSYVAHRGDRTYIYNLGIPGETTEDLLRRFEAEITPRLGTGKQHMVIFAIGMNDTHLVHKKKKWKCMPEEFEGNLRKLIAQARVHTQKIAFVGLNPVEEAKVTPLPWNPEKSYQNERIQAFNAIIESLVKEEGLFFADVWNSFSSQDHKTLLSDGLHPNASGHRRIAERIYAFLQETETGKIKGAGR